MRGTLEGSEATSSGKDGALDVRLSKSGNDVVVHGTLKAELVIPCARCLEPVTLAIEQAVSALMVPAAQVKSVRQGGDEYEFTSGEADTLPYDGETVVLDDLVKDELVLETPMIPLCREDCPGISPASPGPAGARPHEPSAGTAEKSGEKPIDPRLLPLLRLKQNIKE
jgi:uncharacterized protein